MTGLQFLKLGGSLITEKDKPHTARPQVIRRLAGEIAQARRDNPALQLVLGHGSGSFGHVPAQKYGTRSGVRTPEEWQGFVQVWREASALNRLVVEALAEAGLPAFFLLRQPGGCRWPGLDWDTPLIRLQVGLLPVVYGDVVFDTVRGGTILSTEDLFEHLARQLRPTRLLLAAWSRGWGDFPPVSTC
jgi:isopentenyl phosphate kinase